MVLVTLGWVMPDLLSGLRSLVMMIGGGKMLQVNPTSVELVPFSSGLFQKSIAVVVNGGIVMVVVCTILEIDDNVVFSLSSLVMTVVSVQATSSDVVMSGNVTVVGSGSIKGGMIS